MQTFLPYPDFRQSLECLDDKRLGKQRVETDQILNAILCGGGWATHPAVNMWRPFKEALKVYFNTSLDVWEKRGFTNNMERWTQVNNIIMPSWLGRKDFHDSHQSNLLKKDQEFYSRYGWKVEAGLPYVWPEVDLGSPTR